MMYCELKDLGGVFSGSQLYFTLGFIHPCTEIWRSSPSVGSAWCPMPIACFNPTSVRLYGLHYDLLCSPLMSVKKANVSVQF
jgi:hypothetical protein